MFEVWAKNFVFFFRFFDFSFLFSCCFNSKNNNALKLKPFHETTKNNRSRHFGYLTAKLEERLLFITIQIQ